MSRNRIACVVVGAALVSRLAFASNIVMRDDQLITPFALTMDRSDVLEFENESADFVRFVFLEPKDQSERITCYLKDPTTTGVDRTPWALFQWSPAGRLTATMPPGKFGSACTLAPGPYAYIAMRVGSDARVGEDTLATKATITVR